MISSKNQPHKNRPNRYIH